MKFFETFNEKGQGVVIDDTFKNLELLNTIPMKTCEFIKSTYDDKHGHYLLPNWNDKTVLVGIGLNDITGVDPFGIELSREIRIYDQKSGIAGFGIYPSKRDDIANKAKIYLFGWGGNEPTKHMTGLEIYNENGKVIYNSGKKYLNVLGCGSDKAQTFNFMGQTIFFTLGVDEVEKKWVTAHIGAEGVSYEQMPGLRIENGSVKIAPIRATAVYVSEEDPRDHPNYEYICNFSYHYGWLIGSIGERSNL